MKHEKLKYETAIQGNLVDGEGSACIKVWFGSQREGFFVSDNITFQI
jgi:hypothetical protein